MKRIILSLVFISSVLLGSNLVEQSNVALLGNGTISTLDQFISTSSPVSAITQRTFGKPIKITGLSTGDCLTLDTDNLLSTTTCGAGGGGVGTSTNPFMATYFVATSTSATSTFPNISITSGVSILGEYFTNFTAYVRSLFSGGTGISISSGSIALDFSEFSTSNIIEGTNLYWTNTRFDNRLSATTTLPGLTTLTNLTTVGTIGTGVWQGVAIGDAYLTKTGDWTGTFDGIEGSSYLARANHTGTQLAATISDFVATVRTAISETITGIDYNNTTGVFSLTSGYNIPLIASTTNWNTFYDTPSNRITAGTNLSWDGNTLNAAGGSSSNPVIRTYLTAGSPATWSKPAGLKYVVVEVVAGGGTGANGVDNGTNGWGGGGGGAGGYAKKLIATASLGSTETVTTGAAGASSSFGTHVSATAGSNAVVRAAGAGGTGSGGDINLQGGDGAPGVGASTATTQMGQGGNGGNSMYGTGGSGAPDSATAGTAGRNYGGGGGGGAGNGNGASGGAAGAPGIVIVTEYY